MNNVNSDGVRAEGKAKRKLNLLPKIVCLFFFFF